MLLCGSGLALSAGAAAQYPSILVEADSALVLSQVAADRPWYPASLTKLMTLYLTFEALEQGRLDAATELPVSPYAASQPEVKLGLQAGETIPLQTAVRALVAVSSNDVAVVLAEALAPSETAFAAAMTRRARALGMERTRFRNATGLPDPAQVTTARDMAILARRLLIDFPGNYHWFATRAFRFDGRLQRSYNALLGTYAGADGLKTGFTCASGYNLVASAVRDGRRLIGVVLGAASRAERDRRMRALLDTGFAPGARRVGLPRLMQRGAGGALPPPHRLPPERCANGRARPQLPVRSWGILLGVHADRADARRAVSAARARLGGAAPRGRSLILRRKMERGDSWKTLLVGYDRDAAGRACLRLRSRDMICVPQSPVVINAPGYARR